MLICCECEYAYNVACSHQCDANEILSALRTHKEVTWKPIPVPTMWINWRMNVGVFLLNSMLQWDSAEAKMFQCQGASCWILFVWRLFLSGLTLTVGQVCTRSCWTDQSVKPADLCGANVNFNAGKVFFTVLACYDNLVGVVSRKFLNRNAEENSCFYVLAKQF